MASFGGPVWTLGWVFVVAGFSLVFALEPLTFKVEDHFYKNIVDCRVTGVADTPEADLSGLGVVHVAYASDAGNFVGLLSSMLSLSSHVGEPHRCHIHLFVVERDLARAADLVLCFRRELDMLPAVPEVSLHTIRPYINFTSFSGPVMRPYLLKPQTFVRLFLDRYFPDIRRVIWMDHDTIVKYDVGALFRRQMRTPIAAVREWGNGTMLAYHKIMPRLLRRRLPRPTAPVFNSGVMVFDLQRWRSASLLPEKLGMLLPLFGGVNGEQLVLNVMFQDIDFLDWRWNVMGLFVVAGVPSLCINAAKVLHWTWDNKPWLPNRSLEFQRYDHLFDAYRPRHTCRMAAASDTSARQPLPQVATRGIESELRRRPARDEVAAVSARAVFGARHW